MATEVQEKTETEVQTRHIFAHLDQDSATEYKKPNFSGIKFEKPTITEEKTTSNSAAKVDAPFKVKINARGKIIITVLAICICSMLAFMIGNACTINTLNKSVNLKQQQVYYQQQVVDELNSQYNNLDDTLFDRASSNGYSQDNDYQYYDAVEVLDRPSANIETNWFDNLCNFLSNLFS